MISFCQRLCPPWGVKFWIPTCCDIYNVSWYGGLDIVGNVPTPSPIIGDNEDHVDDSTTEVCWYSCATAMEISSLMSFWNLKSWSDLLCWLISILIDPINFRIRTYCDCKGQCVCLWRSYCSNIWCWTASLWTHCRRRAQQRVQVARIISKFIWRQHSTSQIEKCNLKRIEKFETHDGCDCIRQASEGFIKELSLLHWLNCFFR